MKETSFDIIFYLIIFDIDIDLTFITVAYFIRLQCTESPYKAIKYHIASDIYYLSQIFFRYCI